MHLTMTRSSVPTSAPRFARGRQGSVLVRLFAAIAREIRIRRELRALSSFDDAGLHDIGLTRGGMEDAVRHGRCSEHYQVEFERPTRNAPRATVEPPHFTEWR